MKPDGELLAAYLAGDPQAFEEIVRRHGALVLAVCRRVLGQTGEAEEVMQSVFLMLSRKAAELVSKNDLAGWMHRSAWYAATVVLRERRRRAAREKEAGNVVSSRQSQVASESIWEAISPKLDAALSSLPEKHRLALAACYLEGRTQEEVSTAMGVPRNVLAGYCRRGLEALRRKLGVRDTQLTVAAFGLLLTSHATTTVPAGAAALSAAVASGSASAKVALLANATAKAMWWVKVKTAVAMVVLAGALSGAVAFGVLKIQTPAPASGSSVFAASLYVAPIGSPASVAFQALQAQGLSISVLGSQKFPLVPGAMRFARTSGAQLVEGVAQKYGWKVQWSADGKSAVLFPGASDGEIAQLRTDLESADAAKRRDAAKRAATLEDVRTVPLILKAVHDKDVEVKRAALASLRSLVWDAVAALDGGVWGALEEDANLGFPFLSSEIGRCHDEKTLPLLERALHSPDAKVRTTAVKALGLFGGEKARALVKDTLPDVDRAVRNQAYLALAALNDERDVILFQNRLSELKADATGERQSLVCALGYMYNAEALRLVEQACADANPDVRYAAAAAVGHGGGWPALPFLEKLAESPDFRLREGVAYGLGSIGGEKSLALLKRLSSDAHPAVRGDAIYALGEIGNAEAEELLLQALDDKSPEVRGQAIAALGSVGEANAAKRIEKALNDGDPEVRKMAAKVLKELKELK